MSKEVRRQYPFMSYLPEMKIVLEGTDLKSVKPVIDENGVITNQTVSTLECFSHISCNGKFIKLMTDNTKLLMKLNTAGSRMLWVLSVIVQQESMNQAYVHIDYEQAKYISESMDTPLGKQAFYRGIDELIAADILAKASTNGRYWLNVGVLFNGDFAKLPQIMNADPVYLTEQNLARVVNKRRRA